MASLMDLVSHNIGFDLRRRTSRKHTSCPPTLAIQPTLDTSTGIIAIKYAGSDDSSGVSTPRSETSERSLTESGAEDFLVRPVLPKRHASHRVTRSVEEVRLMYPIDEAPPPIPPKSPYRASRIMVQLQNELAETPDSPSLPEEAPSGGIH